MRKTARSAVRDPSPAPSPAPGQSARSALSIGRQNRPSPDSAAEIARYIAQLTAEMAGMAGAARLEMLAYFLSLARTEAEMAAQAEAKASELDKD